MEALFGEILNMSLTASVVILAVILARLALKKAPKIYSYALWAVVLFRLLCPVSLSFELSVLEVASPQVTQTEHMSTVTYVPFVSERTESRKDLTLETSDSIRQAAVQLEEGTAPNPLPWKIAVFAWLAGMTIMLLHSLIAWVRLRINLVGAVHWKGRIWLADRIGSPFVMGVLRPKVYLPSDTPMQERRYIIAHECHHIRRGDHIIKLLAYGALCIHWFNPLVWVSFILAGKDMEMSCDEAVIKKLGISIRADYAQSLLRLATHKKTIAGTPLAFGEGDTKGRVKNMAKWKKPRVWISALCAAVCIAVAAVCGLNPQEDPILADPAIQIGTLPEGYTYDVDGDGNVIFKDGRNTVGGIIRYPIPDGVYDPEDRYFEWLFEVGIPDFEDEALSYMGGMTSGNNGWGAEFASDISEDQEPSVHRSHSCQVVANQVYDIWFDMRHIDVVPRNHIIAAVDFIPQEAQNISALTRTTNEGPTSCAYGELHYTRPGGIKSELREVEGYDEEIKKVLRGEETRNVHIGVWSVDGVEIGGYQDHLMPEGTTVDNMRFVELLDLWELKDENLGRYGGSTAYGNYELEFFTDVPPGTEIDPVHRRHHFYFNEDFTRIYDVWFDLLTVEPAVMEAILKSAVVGGDGPLPVETTPTEAEALAKCKAVVDMVQRSESYKIETYRVNGVGSLNPTSNFTEWGYVDNRLQFNRIPESGGESMFGCLIWDGKQYECDSQAIWQESSPFAPAEPWLVSYQWNEETITYMDTLTDNEGTTVMLRINEENPSVKASDPQYFVNFRFTPDGSFRDVTVQCNLYQSDALLETESIVTLDPDTVWAEMTGEAQRAMGQSITECTPVVTDTVLYQKSFESDDGTVTINVDTLLLPAQLEKNGMTVEQIQTAVEQELRRKTVDNYGLDTTAVGHVGARCEVHVMQIKSGDDYLVAADKAFPTLEVWGTRTYIFANGDRLGEEQGSIKLLLLNAADGTILISFGEKN